MTAWVGRWRYGTALGLLGLVLALSAGCERPTPRRGGGGEFGAEGPGGRRQPLALNPRQELAVGRRAYQEVLKEYSARLLPYDDPHVERVRAITNKIVRASEIEPLQREINLRLHGYHFEWEVNVIREKQINAFCLPGGKIAVFTGIFEVTGRDDDFMATVLSHEIAHALAHHASERVAREQSGEWVLRKLKYDREQESEADHIGVFLMTFAGYDPDKAVKFWERMSKAHGARGQVPEFLSDHPSDEHRIKALEKWAPKARAAKEAYDEGRIAPPRDRERGGR